MTFGKVVYSVIGRNSPLTFRDVYHLPKVMTFSIKIIVFICRNTFFKTTSEGFDGKFNSTNRCYRMRITRQIQQLLTGTVPDLPMVLYVNSRRSSANRCIISGTATDKPMKLKIIYTE